MSVDLPGWMHQAACLDADRDLFFTHDPDAQAQALQLCATCPVRIECLAHALHRPEEIGIWGGRTEAQLRDLRRELKRAADNA